MSSNSVYALLAKKDKAHDDKIYGGEWAQITVQNQKHDFIVTGGLDKVVKVWQLDNYQLDLIHTLKGHKMGVVSVVVSPDGHTIASISIDEPLCHIFNLGLKSGVYPPQWKLSRLLSGNKVHEVGYFGHAFWTAAFSPQGDFLAVAGYSGKIVIRQMGKNEEVQTLDTRANVHGKFIISVAWSPDGTLLAVGSVDGVVRVYDMFRDGFLKHTIQAHKEPVRKVAFSANSKLLATASADGMVKIYKVKNASVKGTLDHKCWALCVCFSKDGTRIATADDAGCVRVARASPLSHKTGDSDDESSGHGTMTSISNGNVRTVEVATEKTGTESMALEVLNVFKEHLQAAWCVQFSPDQTMLLSVSKDQSINIYGLAALPKKK